jgi:hypothetical protein
MESTRPVMLDRQPMVITDQHGVRLFGWFPDGTPTDPAHVLPAEVYTELCRLSGVPIDSPWVAFDDRVEAVVTMAAACLVLGYSLTPVAT